MVKGLMQWARSFAQRWWLEASLCVAFVAYGQIRDFSLEATIITVIFGLAVFWALERLRTWLRPRIRSRFRTTGGVDETR